MRCHRACLVRSPPVVNATASGVPCESCFPFPKTQFDSFHSSPPSALSIGHGFGGIPAPCGFRPSAFPFPPKNLRERRKRFIVPLPKCSPSPWEQTPLAFECPNYEGKKGDSKMYENRVELMGFLGKNPESKSTKKTGRTLAILSLVTKTRWTGRFG